MTKRSGDLLLLSDRAQVNHQSTLDDAKARFLEKSKNPNAPAVKREAEIDWGR
jgi:hypothetical protein